jgi:hypothetical protein
VLMQAPDGTTKSVPQSQVAYYLSKGARVIQGGSSAGTGAGRGFGLSNPAMATGAAS